jgi:hypothetical protein
MIIAQAGFSVPDFRDILIKNVLPVHGPHIAGYAVKQEVRWLDEPSNIL